MTLNTLNRLIFSEVRRHIQEIAEYVAEGRDLAITHRVLVSFSSILN